MTEHVATIPRNASLADAQLALLQTARNELFVVDEDGFVVGILPDYVLLRWHLSGAESRPAEVQSVMSRRFLVIGPDSPLSTAARYLRDHVHHRLAVVDNRRLVGVLTRTDVLRHLAGSQVPEDVAA